MDSYVPYLRYGVEWAQMVWQNVKPVWSLRGALHEKHSPTNLTNLKHNFFLFSCRVWAFVQRPYLFIGTYLLCSLIAQFLRALDAKPINLVAP